MTQVKRIRKRVKDEKVNWAVKYASEYLRTYSDDKLPVYIQELISDRTPDRVEELSYCTSYIYEFPYSTDSELDAEN